MADISWLTVLGFLFLTFNSGMAVYRSNGDTGSIIFVVVSYVDLVALFGFLRYYERLDRHSPKREKVKAAVWSLTTLLTVMFSYKVSSQKKKKCLATRSRKSCRSPSRSSSGPWRPLPPAVGSTLSSCTRRSRRVCRRWPANPPPPSRRASPTSCRKAHTGRHRHSRVRRVRSTRAQGQLGCVFTADFLASLIHLSAVTSAVLACRGSAATSGVQQGQICFCFCCCSRHRSLWFAPLLATGNLGLLLIGAPGVHATVHVPATRMNFWPCYRVSLLDCSQAQGRELFVVQVESKGREELMKKYRLSLYMQHMEATVIISVSRNSCRFGAEQETQSAKGRGRKEEED